MRQLLATCLVVPLVCVACGDDPPAGDLTPEERAVVGTWEIDVEAFEASFVRMVESQMDETVRSGTLEPEDVATLRGQLHGQLREQFAGMWGRFDFAEDGTFAGDGKDGTARGTWKVDASRLSMTHTHEKGVPVPKPETWFGMLRADTIVLRPEPEKDYELTLVRARP